MELIPAARWVPPMMGFFKVNFVVTIQDSFAVGAAVIKDYCGRVAGACVQQILVEDPEDGEIWAAQIGIEEARRCGFKQIIVEGDSSRAIEAIHHYPEKVKLVQLWEDWRFGQQP